jgi:hypothetical protein
MMQQSTPEEFGAYVGIDWADHTHFVSMRDASSQEVKRYKLEQKPEMLLQWVNELQQRFPGQRVAVALEQTRGALIYALMSYEFFVYFQ